MKNSQSNEQVVTSTNYKAPWVKLWIMNWNYSHWLMTSIISTVICSEVYSVLLSVYPDFLTTFLFNLGITSSFMASALAISSVLLVGLLSGWLIYSAHLAFYAFKTANHDYQPLIELWKSYQNNNELIDKLLTDKNFYNLSKYLQEQNLPEPIQSFLGNQQNMQQISKVMNLLKRIWQIERLDDKIKALSINILSEFSKTENTQEHLDNIWNLCDMLLNKNEFTHENVLKSLENSQQLKTYIPTLSQLSMHKDLLHKFIEEPKLMEFFLAAQEEFQGQDERINHNIDLLHLYMVNRFEQAEVFNLFRNSNHINTPKATVSSLCYSWIKNFNASPHQFIKLWDNLIHHPNLEWLDGSVNLMLGQSEKYTKLILDYDSAFNLTGLFNRLTTSKTEEFKQFVTFYNSLTELEDKELFCDVLLCLNDCHMLKESLIIELFNSNDWRQVANNLKRYVDTLWTPNNPILNTETDIKQLLINPDEIFPIPKPVINIATESIETPNPIDSPVKTKKGFFSLFNCSCSSSTPNSPKHHVEQTVPSANF